MASSETAPRRTAAARTKQWGAYLLRCGDGSLYAGASNDLAKRLLSHQAGKASRYTRSRLPVDLVYWEPCADKSAALRREAAIKRLPRPAKLALVAAGSASTELAGDTHALDTRDIALQQ